jgi:hypothetical protein
MFGKDKKVVVVSTGRSAEKKAMSTSKPVAVAVVKKKTVAPMLAKALSKGSKSRDY